MPEEKKRSRRAVWIVAAAILIVWAASRSWHAPNGRIPDDLVGEWRTTDANYADRWLEIDPVSINFVTGNGHVSTGFIKEIKAVPENGRTLYTISYLVDDTLNEVSFYYAVGKEKTIRFKHQESIVWIKDKTASSSDKIS